MTTAPSASFYLLASTKYRDLLEFICKLTEKVLYQSHFVYIKCSQSDQANDLDALLYSFRDDSFLPHQKTSKPLTGPVLDNPPYPIFISPLNQALPANWVVINLAPDHYTNAHRIIEIATNEEVNRQLARQKFVQYRQLGFQLQTHRIEE